jgi:hypothetical protein
MHTAETSRPDREEQNRIHARSQERARNIRASRTRRILGGLAASVSVLAGAGAYNALQPEMPAPPTGEEIEEGLRSGDLGIYVAPDRTEGGVIDTIANKIKNNIPGKQSLNEIKSDLSAQADRNGNPGLEPGEPLAVDVQADSDPTKSGVQL